MSRLTERQLFAAYGVPYDEEGEPEPATPVARPMHALTPIEIRQRVAAHNARQEEGRAIAEVRHRQLRRA